MVFKKKKNATQVSCKGKLKNFTECTKSKKGIQDSPTTVSISRSHLHQGHYYAIAWGREQGAEPRCAATFTDLEEHFQS